MTIIGMFDTVPLIHEGKKTGTTLMHFLRGTRQEDAFLARHNTMLLGSELSDLGLSTGEMTLMDAGVDLASVRIPLFYRPRCNCVCVCGRLLEISGLPRRR